MKKTMLTLAALLGLAAAAHAAPPAPYVAVFRVTPGASPSHILAFQNVSSGENIVVDRVEIAAASTQTVTGGQAQYWVYASTQLTHSASAGYHLAYGSALASAPSAISASTAPLNVLLEGDSGILTAAQRHDLAGTARPLIRPLVVDSDDAATVNRSDAWSSIEGATQAQPLLLPAGSNRALVIEKRQGAASDFTAGAVHIRIFYWRK